MISWGSITYVQFSLDFLQISFIKNHKMGQLFKIYGGWVGTKGGFKDCLAQSKKYTNSALCLSGTYVLLCISSQVRLLCLVKAPFCLSKNTVKLFDQLVSCGQIDQASFIELTSNDIIAENGSVLKV